MSNRAYYGKIGVATLSSEVRDIWYSRHKEPDDEPPSEKWSFEYEDRLDERVENAELLGKLLACTELTARDRLILHCICVQGMTESEVGACLSITRSRVHQLLHRTLRLLRLKANDVVGTRPHIFGFYEGDVLTWRAWRRLQQENREFAKRNQL